MKICPNCKEEVEKGFDICWNCNYCFSEDKVVEFKDSESVNSLEINCLRCNVPMKFSGKHDFHEGSRLGIFGNLFEIFVNRESFHLYICPQCAKVEFFCPEKTNQP